MVRCYNVARRLKNGMIGWVTVATEASSWFACRSRLIGILRGAHVEGVYLDSLVDTELTRAVHNGVSSHGRVACRSDPSGSRSFRDGIHRS